MNFVILLGRILYSLLFIMASLGHFTQGTIAYATSQGIPMASFLVPLSGIIGLLGGLSILLGYKAKIGAWLIVIFLIPVTFSLHKFWGLTNEAAASLQQVMFMKNMALLGGAFIITYFGSGPFSIKK